MKRILFTLLALLALTLGAQAQRQMLLNMKNGTTMNIFVSEIESVTWTTDDVDTGENNPDDPPVTGEAQDITENSALIVGYANGIRDNESTDLKIGIIYCTEGTPNKSHGTQKTVSKSQVAADGKYTIRLTGLTRGTTYYYRSFVYQSGLWFYGKVRSFRTISTIGQDVTATFQTGSATNVTCFSAKVSAQMSLTTTLSYSSMSYGICYGTEAEPTKQLSVSSKDAAGYFTAQLRALAGNTIYYYRPYVTVDGTTYYGQTSSFKTLEDNVVETGTLDADGNVRSRLTIGGGGAYSTLEVGLCWSSDNSKPTISDKSATTNELDDENYYVIAPTFYVGTNYYRAYVKIDGVAHYGAVKDHVQVHGYVDLGLPSGTLWATCNVGAESPEDYGDYFAWGEVEPKSTYDWSTYFDSVNGSSRYFKKYYNDGGKTELDLEDDAAYMNWGEGWRMPSLDQIEELYNSNYTTTQWTTQNGKDGYLITSKSNGASLFLPEAGYRNEGSLYAAGMGGSYWSRSLSLYTILSCFAYSLDFNFGYIDRDYHNRCSGFSVRPVREFASE